MSKRTASISKLKELWAQQWLRRCALGVFFIFVTALLVRQGMKIEWSKVGTAITEFKTSTIAAAAGLTALSYLVYSCFDVLARRYTRVNLPAYSMMKTAFMSYAFNQSLGSLVGGIAFRFRLYTKLGLDAVQISKIVLFCIVTNWLGYAVLAGSIFVTDRVALSPGWELGRFGMHLTGWVLIVIAFSYMALCGFFGGRGFKWRTKEIEAPRLPLASMQLMLSIVHWPVAATVVYVLLGQSIDFTAVLGALLLSAVATSLAHIPAGVGVLESIFVGLFRETIPVPQLLAALVLFRVVYYLCPLALATLTYFATEATSTRKSTKQKRGSVSLQSNSLPR
jgi:uncharacterized membrane protein YbhN (UPF0104 family)